MFDRHVRERLQADCERGQEELIATDYLAAAATLAGAEAAAWDAEDFDTLARLYMPLQEARRQIRLRAGEGAVASVAAGDFPAPDAVLDRYPQGQLLVTDPDFAGAVRQLAAERRLYVEAIAAASDESRVTAVPWAGPASDAVPSGGARLAPGDWPPPTARGTPETFAKVSAVWERLHAPFLAVADAEPDPLRRMAAYRRTIAVDAGCEFAHQRLSATASNLARQLARHGA